MKSLHPTRPFLWRLPALLVLTVLTTAGIRVVELHDAATGTDDAETSPTAPVSQEAVPEETAPGETLPEEEDFELPDLPPSDGDATTSCVLPSVPAADFLDNLTSLTSAVIVAPGDNFPVLARRHDTTVERILALNPGLGADSRLIPGSALRVPDSLDRPPALPDLSLELRRGLRGRKQIALTFDAAWVTDNDLNRLLDTLTTHGVKATFFLTGVFLDQHPKAAKRIALRDFPIHNHTRSHPHCLKLSDDEISSQLLSVDRAVEKATGHPTRPFWRPPYGERDKRVLQVAAQAGFRSVCWTIDSLDWVTDPPRTPEMLFERVCVRPFERAKADPDPLDGAIILFHVGGKATADALDRIIPYLRERGYRFVWVPEMLKP